jgi:rhamnogalacturonyl hydrolase YesR
MTNKTQHPMIKKIVIGLLIMQLHHFGYSQMPLKVWPKGSTPEEVGLKVAELFVNNPYLDYNEPGFKKHISYFEVCAWYGALSFAKLVKNPMLSSRLITRFDPLMTRDTALLPVADHVDYSVFGTVPLEIYLQTKTARYLDLGLGYADKQWGPPFGPRLNKESLAYYNKGLTWQTRLWIDDMYMITMVQAQAYRATGDLKYINRAAKEMVLYLDELQKPNGFFYHAPDAPFFWGRGNGWMAAGMTELLRVLPRNNPDYPRIFKGYTGMMASLLKYQTPGGSWRQLIDDPASWEESSCTGMFTFALVTGVKNGWLDKNDYGPAARKGWLALVGFINDKGEVTQVCEGTGRKNDRQYYLDRKKNTGDMHGQAPVLWCASALLREKEKL